MTWISENVRVRVVVIIALLLVACFFGIRGCGPGEVTPQTYDFAKSLVQLLQRRDDPRLPKSRETSLNEIREQIGTAEIPPGEADMLTGIIDTALSGDVDDAKSSLKELMDAQVDK